MTAKGETTTVELSRTQQTIARRMAESKATIPDFTLQIDVDMQECVTLRAQLQLLSHHEHGPEPDAPVAPRREQLQTPTYNDMVVKAAALALREHPTANGSYRDGRLELHSRVNVGVAVAAVSSSQGENTLVVPTVFDADEKSLGEIARETRTLAERVRTAVITPPELGGGTFTVSNLGMYGVKSFTAIINPPQAGILSVGALAPRAVVRDGELTARNTMTRRSRATTGSSTALKRRGSWRVSASCWRRRQRSRSDACCPRARSSARRLTAWLSQRHARHPQR